MSNTTYSSPDLTAYFQSKRAGLEAQLAARAVDFIAATESTLDCAIYDLRHPEILTALAQLAHKPHVRLRIAYDGSGERNGADGDPKPAGSALALNQAGLAGLSTAIHEHGRHLMHDKFLVRDGRAVWVGSANLTVGGLELQDNNCLEITSPALASTYTATFEELISPQHAQSHDAGRHAAGRAALAPSSVTVGGAHITPYFAPAAGEGIEDALVAALRRARRVRILAFLIGDPGILDALAPFASDHHFDIRGVYDPHGMQDVTRPSHPGGHEAHAGRTGKGGHPAPDDTRFWFLHDPRFVAAPTHGFAPGREQDFMHNKVIIIDDRLVFTGSYNFSENAEANDETLLAIESPAVAAAYTAYFDTLAAAYAHAETREPVAVGAGAEQRTERRTGAAALATGAAVSGDEVVSRLRQQQAAEQRVPARASGRSAARSASSAAPRGRSALDGVITLVITLMALTALALIAYAALTLNGVNVLPFLH
ncbi:MAG TPA: phospholipase D-like domain-containing protein [Ktedonobacterales bacterium]|jgi:phosphatidylserine/phosphatidylglycerophosphate/cardiolipin synthase-like enzyme